MDSSGRQWPRADLRVGDADRQAVVDELQRHYIDGRLNSDELGERVSDTWNARTFADLAVPLNDLPRLPNQLPVPAQPQLPHEWEPADHGGLQVGVVLIMAVLLLSMFMLPGIHQMRGLFAMWPLLIWGFLFMARLAGSGRRHW